MLRLEEIIMPFASLIKQVDLLNIDLIAKRAAVGSRHLALTRKEFELLAVLVQNAGVVVPRGVLLQLVWGYGPDIETRTLDVHIRRLRKKIGSHGEQYIETVFGIGYRFQPFREADRYQPDSRLPPIVVAA
jgi:DNA-binding response OmpR family regulator